ncbi:MAG: RNA polymerase sigma factor SigM [Sporichthyaceae bacterium]|nr:RNA polymerase sigma factor SigM [Sporichthyaceae bacterium]
MADPDAPITDAELLAGHVNGDPDAFSELFRRHRDRMWAIALRTMGDPEDAADALQDALISAFRRAGSFRGEAAVTTWLHRIVVNACLDRIRRRAVRPTVPLVDQRLPDPTAEREVGLDVAAALARLPAEQRAALVLVDMQGYSVEEAAAILGVPSGTIKSRCARGRARLLPHLVHLRPSFEGRAATGNRRGPDPVQPATPQTATTRSEGGERAR